MYIMIKVYSSAISAIGYDNEHSVLYIEFKDGGVYRYFDVPSGLHKSLMTASSIGSYFDREVRKKNYRFEVVQGA